MSGSQDTAHMGDMLWALMCTLPPELISVIFILGRDMADEFPNDAEYLLRITSVCSLWRSMALSTPELWININTKDMMCNHFKTMIRTRGRLRAYIARSKDASLDISVDFTRCRQLRAPYSTIIEMFVTELFSAQLHRCRSLTLLLNNTARAESFLPLRGPLDRLRHFNFVFGGGPLGVPRAQMPNIRLFEPDSALGLREFHISGAGSEPGFRHALSSVPMNALRRCVLRVNGATWAHVSDFLMTYSSVKDLTLEGSLLPHEGARRSLSLHNLKRLTVTPGFFSYVNQCVSVPHLEELVMVPEYPPSTNAVISRPLSEKVRAVTLRGPQLPYFACLTLQQGTVRVINVECLRPFDTSTLFDPLFALLLGISGGFREFTGWETYIPAKDPSFPHLEFINIWGGLWGADPAAFAPAVVHLLDSRPNLRIRIKTPNWRVEPHIDALRAVEVQYGDRFVFSFGEI